MKRPDVVTIFGPAPIACAEVAARVLDHFASSYEGELSPYYAQVVRNTETGNFRSSRIDSIDSRRA